MGREERAGKNEALFRSINERIAATENRQGSNGGRITFLCECVDLACVARIELTPTEYERVRADARQFAVALEHENATIELVVEEGDSYVVVRKHDEASSIAEETDPRS
jgi:hypothetical protein